MTFKEITRVLAVMAVLFLVLVGIIAAGATYWWRNNG